MREHPILFSSPMVRALLREVGPKTQTRRVVTVPFGQGKRYVPWDPYYADFDGCLMFQDQYGDWHDFEKDAHCPYGSIGDRLWVRETFRVLPSYDDEGKSIDNIQYRADGHKAISGWSWTPSIHMPRWASRITLEITGVRVERLRDISKEDAKAEGVMQTPFGSWIIDDGWTNTTFNVGPINVFADYWDSIYAKRGQGWADDPWVWRIEFRKD